ncbi:cardiolipin synthase [Bacillus tianshenii]|nr:cardiolipin synthase [Bacillus tianshenii]
MWVLILLFFIIYFYFDFRLGQRIHNLVAKPRNYSEKMMDWELFGDGQTLYEKLFKDIHEAEHHIHTLFFIIKNDNISKEFLQLLKQKAQQGVTVRLLLDRIGGIRLPKKQIQLLKKAGVQFAYANKPAFPFIFFSLQKRNHRKVTVIDGKISYFGGFNIGEEYLGRNPRLGFWRDFHMRITGEATHILQKEFFNDWKRATKEELTTEDQYFPLASTGQTPCTFLPTDGNGIQSPLLKMIQRAKKEIIIASPYFIPGKIINSALIEAAKRGVHVIILVPLKADHPLVREAAFPYFYGLLKAGCHIHRYDKGFYHGKVVLVDHEICDIGTANFDKRSFFLNDELNCFIKDPSFLKRIYAEVMEDLDNARELTLDDYRRRSFMQRPIELVSSLLSGLL